MCDLVNDVNDDDLNENNSFSGVMQIASFNDLIAETNHLQDSHTLCAYSNQYEERNKNCSSTSIL